MRIFALLLLSFLTAPGPVRAQAPLEAEIKAAFVLNFARFAEFSLLPAEQKNIHICLSSSDEVFKHFSIIRDKEVRGRKVILRHLAPNETTFDQCQIVYFATVQKRSHEMTSNLIDSHVLTIGDQDDFIDQGGMIRFYLEEGKIRFEISPQNVANSQIQLSSKLLSIAKIRNVTQ